MQSEVVKASAFINQMEVAESIESPFPIGEYCLSHIQNPVLIGYGRGCLQNVALHVQPPTLVICSPGTRLRRDFSSVFGPNVTHYYTEVDPNPSPKVVLNAVEIARSAEVRTIVGLGGGSVMDVAKTVSILLELSASQLLSDTWSVPPQTSRTRTLIQIPTTSGSGSEVTRWASIWLPSGVKTSFNHESCYADIAFVDPSLTDTLSVRLTLATGMDALGHALECIWSRNHTDDTDCIAVRVIELVKEHLESAMRSPSPRSRDGMSLAALLGGLALSQCESAAAHALSYPLTGAFGVEHGLAVGLFCRALLAPVELRCPKRLALILKAMHLQNIAAASEFIINLFRVASLEPRLAFFEIPESAMGDIVKTAMSSRRLANQDGHWTPADLANVVRSAY